MSTPSSDPPTRSVDPVDRSADTHPVSHPTASDQTWAAGGGPPPAAAAAAAPPGYELLGEIGRGGMGVVYRARDLVLDRDVAVKLLSDRYAPGSATAHRFAEEARITAQLQHPGVPAVHQIGTLPDGRPFLAMKLIRGRTLDELLKERPDPSADRGRSLAVFEAVCQAVGYAHAHKVVHRDLKPQNVMVGAFAEVQVMDWGLAKVLASGGARPRRPGDDPDATLGTEVRPARGGELETEAGSLLGTPAYMAPEQAIGAVDRIDDRSDVFGLGGVLCVILTGLPPYVGESAESIRQLAARAKLDEAHARLNACGAEPDLVVLCKRCLAPEKADRQRDAGEVARAVAELRAAAEDRARRAEIERAAAEFRAAEERKRRRMYLLLAAFVLACVAVAAAYLMRDEIRDEEAAKVAARVKEREDHANEMLSVYYASQTRSDSALELLRKLLHEAIERYRSSADPDDRLRRQVIDDLKSVIERVSAVALDTFKYKWAAELNLGWARLSRADGRNDEAMRYYQAAIDYYAAMERDPAYKGDERHTRAWAHAELGGVLHRSGRSGEAVTELTRARNLFARLAEKPPASPSASEASAIVLLSVVALDLGQTSEAVRLLGESRVILDALFDVDPRDPFFCRASREYYHASARAALARREHAAVVGCIDGLLDYTHDPANDRYDAGCFLARCVPLALSDGRIPADQRVDVAEKYAIRAIESLHQAVRVGWRDITHTRSDEDLVALHGRADFERFLAEFRKRLTRELAPPPRPAN